MIKAEMQEVKVVDFLIAHQHDPGRPPLGRRRVRRSGQLLRDGEWSA